MNTVFDRILSTFVRLAVLFLSFCLLLSYVGLIFGISISKVNLPLALVGAVAVAHWGAAGSTSIENRRLLASGSALLILVLVSGGLLIKMTPDVSYDGNAYHLVSIIALRDGWNFFGNGGLVAWAMGSGLYDARVVQSIAEGGLWNDHYPKGAWILGATVLTWFPDVSYARWVNPFAAVVAFATLHQAFRTSGCSRGGATMLGLGAACCPIVLAQVFTNYVDGLMGSFLAISIGLLLICNFNRDPVCLVGAFLAGLLAASLKFTGLVYVVLLFGSFLLCCPNIRASLTGLLRFRMLSLGCLLAAVLSLWNPYVSNLIEHQHPFYPINKTDVMRGQADPGFMSQNRWVKYWGANTASLLPKASSGDYLPVWVERPNLKRYRDALREADPRVQGMGPHFVVILLLSFAAALVSLKYVKSADVAAPTAMHAIQASAAWLFACMLVNPEFWWARYLPQLWLLPFLISGMLLSMNRRWLAMLIALPAAAMVAANLGCFIQLMPYRNEAGAGLLAKISSGSMKVSDKNSNTKFLFTMAAVAAEHGARLELIPSSRCQEESTAVVATCR